jgi:ketosteroid isomerase-like protein
MDSERASRNSAVVREVYAAFARRDIPAILAVLSPDVEWVEPENPFNPAAGSKRGEAGFLEWIRIGKETEEVLALDLEQLIAGDDTVAVVGHMRCLAKPTGRTYESDFVHVFSLRDGKISRFQEFFDTYAAGEAFRTSNQAELE